MRTRDDRLFQAWLTRRMMLRLWAPLADIVTKLQIAQASPQAHVMPEARAMVAQAARERTLAVADFKTPFVPTVREQPLGDEPLLVFEAQLTRLPGEQLRVVLLDEQRKSMALQLNAQLVTGLHQLLQQALRQADWGLALDPAPAAEPAAALAPRVLN